MENSEKRKNPHSYRGFVCKSDADTCHLTAAFGQECEYDSFSTKEYDFDSLLNDDSPVGGEWHPRWEDYTDDRGVLHYGYKNKPYLEIKRGFDFFIHGYRATMQKVMTDGEWFKLFSSLKSRYGGGFTLEPKGKYSGIFWELVYTSVYGVRIYVNRKSESVTDIPEYHLMIETDGKYCERKGIYDIGCEIVWLFNENGFKMTRVDPKVRDCECRVTIDELEVWRDRGQIRGVRLFDPTRHRLHNLVSFGAVAATPRTFYAGSRISSKLLRVYEPELLHHAGGIDWEVEYKRNFANEFAQKLSDCISRIRDDDSIPFQFFEMYVAREFCRLIADSVFAAVNIIEKNEKTRDYDRLPEYQALIDAVFSHIDDRSVTFYSPTKLKPKRPPLPTIDTKITWLFKQVAPSFKAVLNSFCDDASVENFIRAFLDDGEDRISRFLKAVSDEGFKTPPDIEGELRRLEVMEMLPAV